MAIIFYDGFDHYATADMPKKWTTTNTLQIGGLSSSYARLSGQGLQVGNNSGSGAGPSSYVARGYINRKTVVVGTAFMYITPDNMAGVGNVGVYDAGTCQIDWRLNSGQILYVTRNGTTLFTTTYSISLNVWYFIELKATIDPSAGYVELRVNGAVQGTFTGNTSGSGSAYSNQLRIGFLNSGGSFAGAFENFDDVYVLEADSGAGAVDFLGDCRVQTLLPNGAGTTSGMNKVYPINRALGMPVTVIDTTTGPASNITDGTTTTFWRSSTDTNANPWFYIDLGSAMQIDAFWFVQQSTGAISSQFRIEHSPDHITWTTSWVSASGLGGSEYQTQTLLTTPASDRYWRFYCLAGGGNDWQIAEAALLNLSTTSANYLGVNEQLIDTSGSVYANTAGVYDTYQYADLSPTSNRVFAVAQSYAWQKDDAGSRTATMRVRSGGSEADFATPVTPTTGSYTVIQQIQETNPVSGVAWTVSDVNNAEFGPKVAT